MVQFITKLTTNTEHPTVHPFSELRFSSNIFITATPTFLASETCSAALLAYNNRGALNFGGLEISSIVAKPRSHGLRMRGIVLDNTCSFSSVCHSRSSQ